MTHGTEIGKKMINATRKLHEMGQCLWLDNDNPFQSAPIERTSRYVAYVLNGLLRNDSENFAQTYERSIDISIHGISNSIRNFPDIMDGKLEATVALPRENSLGWAFRISTVEEGAGSWRTRLTR
jgi:hypothetical protein